MARPYSKISINILEFLNAVGETFLAASSPDYRKAFWRIYQKQMGDPRIDYKQYEQCFTRLNKSQLIQYTKMREGAFFVKLTAKGEQKMQQIRLYNLTIKQPKKWDGTWRIVLYDIPNTKNKGREALRLKLKHLGFYQLQKSVWAFPYPCEPEIEFLVELFGLRSYVYFLETSKIKNDLVLKRRFHLL